MYTVTLAPTDGYNTKHRHTHIVVYKYIEQSFTNPHVHEYTNSTHTSPNIVRHVLHLRINVYIPCTCTYSLYSSMGFNWRVPPYLSPSTHELTRHQRALITQIVAKRLLRGHLDNWKANILQLTDTCIAAQLSHMTSTRGEGWALYRNQVLYVCMHSTLWLYHV